MTRDMREILFRGKRIDNGEWANGNYVEKIHYYDGSELPCIQVVMQKPSVSNRFVPCFETELVEVVSETVGQYTGLKDKNGKMIFEGDIVHIDNYDEGWDSVVEFNGGAFAVGVEGRDYDYTAIGWTEYQSIIIGNIYDNPELLEEAMG